MGATRARRLLAAITIAGCALSAACGDGAEPEPPGPAAETAPSSASPASARPESEEEDRPLAQLPPEEVGPAFEALGSPDREIRRSAVRELMQGGYPCRAITEHALHVVQRGEDVGLLADLLADHPEDALPRVLHRITHTAVIQTAQLCRALGRRRESVTAALAVLLVRALLDPGELVRTEARLALWNLNPAAVEIVEVHFRIYPKSVDGSVLHISAALLLGPGNLSNDTPFRRALDDALDADAARFSDETGQAVAAYKAQCGGSPPAWFRPGAALSGWGAEELRLAEHLAGRRSALLGELAELLDRPGYLLPVLLAYGHIASQAQSHAPRVLAAWRKELQTSLGSRAEATSEEPLGALVSARWYEEGWAEPTGRRLGGAAAWALVRLGNPAPEILEGLWEMLTWDISRYDRRLVEVALQALRPRGRVIQTLLAVVSPPLSPEGSIDVIGSARTVLPWSLDAERADLMGAIDERLQARKWRRRERMILRSIQYHLKDMQLDADEQVEALIQSLRRHVLSD